MCHTKQCAKPYFRIHKYHSRVARKKPMLSASNIEKRLTFAIEMKHQPEDYWNNVIFCDETKMMLYYNDGPKTLE